MSPSESISAAIENLVATLKSSNTGILVVGHGTRKFAGQGEFLKLVEHLAALVPDTPVGAAFLELASPDIDAGVKGLAAQGVKGIVVIPVLLFYAGHARTDIPDAVRQACEAGGVEFRGTSLPLDTHPGAIELSEMRFMESLQSLETAPTSSKFESVVLAMVGRGTSDTDALERMREFTRIRCDRIEVKWNQTGFFAGGEPKVEELLQNAANAASTIETESEPAIVIVQPHLLFEGELMDQLREYVSLRQSDKPNQVWRLAKTLGAEPALAKVFLSILAETMTESSLRNQ